MKQLYALLLLLLACVLSPAALACTSCSAALQTGAVDDLCLGSDTRYDALARCLCTDNCPGECASTSCQGLPANDACNQCANSHCSSALNACYADVSGCEVGAVDCGNNTCCAAPAEACLPDGSCLLPCPEGQYRCGEDRCAEVGNDCCADLGFPDITCPPGHECGENGNCVLDLGGSSCERGGCDTSGPTPGLIAWASLLGALGMVGVARSRQRA